MKMPPDITLCLNTGRHKVLSHYLQNYRVHFMTCVWWGGKYGTLQWKKSVQASTRTVLLIMPCWSLSPGFKIWCKKRHTVHCCVVSPGDSVVRLQDIAIALSVCCVWGWIICRSEEWFQSVLHYWPLWKWKFCSAHVQFYLMISVCSSEGLGYNSLPLEGISVEIIVFGGELCNFVVVVVNIQETIL